MEFDLESLFKNNSYTDSSPTGNSSKRAGPKNKSKISRLLGDFDRAFRAQKRWRSLAKKYDDFYDGNQLTDEERLELRARSQPDVVINKIKPQIDLVLGLRARFQKRVKTFARNESEDDILTAEAFDHALRFVDQRNMVEFTDGQVFEDGAIRGRGWFYVHVELDEEFEPEIKISYVPGSDIVWDPDATAFDLSDAKKLWHTVWFDEDDLIALFPKKERIIRRAAANFLDPTQVQKDGIDAFTQTKKFAGDDYLARMYTDQDSRDLWFDKGRGRMRVTNHWYKTNEKRTVILHPDLGVAKIGSSVSQRQIDEAVRHIAEQSGVPPEMFDKVVPVMKVCTLIGGEELEEKDSPYEHGEFPFIPYTCFRDRQTNDPYGLVKPSMDPQREVNKRRSKALHILNTNQIIADDGAVDDEEKAREEVARPDGYIKKNRGMDFEIKRDSEMGQAQLRMYEMSIQEIQETTGISPDLEGRITNARSGEAIDRRIEQGLAVLSKVFTNWRWTKLNVAKQIVQLIQQFWTSEKAIRVTDDQNVVKFLRLNEHVTTKGGQDIVVRNVRTGKYDVIFDEAEDSVNLGEDVFRELAKLAQTGQIPPSIVMEFAPIPWGVKQRIIQQLTPQPQAGAPGAQVPPGTPGVPNELANVLPAQGQGSPNPTA